MEVNDKITELEEELKLLKAEIRNVLLDIREVVLERRNPLGEEHESAFIRMDLNTTARSMAAEAAAREATKAVDSAPTAPEPSSEAAEPEPTAAQQAPEPEDAQPAPQPEETSASPEPEQAASTTQTAPQEQAATAQRATEQRAAPSAVAEDEAPLEGADIPHMYMRDLAPLSGNGSLAAWITEAIDTVGVEDLRRVITMFRLWGNVPPNISRALAYLQELLANTDEPRPSWLRVLQDLDRLASL